MKIKTFLSKCDLNNKTKHQITVGNSRSYFYNINEIYKYNYIA